MAMLSTDTNRVPLHITAEQRVAAVTTRGAAARAERQDIVAIPARDVVEARAGIDPVVAIAARQRIGTAPPP